MEVVLAGLDDLLHQRRRLRHATLTDVELMLADSDALIAAARVAMDVRSIDAIVAMVSAGLGVSIVPQPRQALLDAHGVRAVALGRRRPARQIAFVARRAGAENRNAAAVAEALMG